MKDELLITNVNRMTSVGPALVSGDDVCLFGQDIHNFPFSSGAIQSPLGACLIRAASS